MNIDIVYLWVNGNDPQWQAKRNATIGRPDDHQQVNCTGRYADNGELRYSLRSVERYAPWIRRIFIVTDNQVPEWLDTSHPKVQIVDHTEILPSECLPCFNSSVIELFLHRIPGLSEHFLYANDDMMINRPVTPSNFFAPDGLPYIFMLRKPMRKLALWYRTQVLGKTLPAHTQTLSNSSLLVERHLGHYLSGKPHHNIDAYLRSHFEPMWEEFGQELQTMLPHHMRSREDYERVLINYTALLRGRGHLRYVSQHHSFRLHIDNPRLFRKFERYCPILFCMNDSEYANDSDRQHAQEYASRLFPDKSSFEK